MLQWLLKRFNPAEPRDARGRWTASGTGVKTRVLERGAGVRKAWKDIIAMPPKAYFQELLGGTGLQVGTLYVSYNAKTKRLRYSAALVTPDGSHAGWLDRHFYTNEEGALTVEHHMFELERALQGRGIAKQVFRNAVSQYGRMGVSRIDNQAALGAGGSVWPKFGFLPYDKTVWKSLKAQITTRIAGLPGPVRTAYTKLLDSNHPLALWAIADSKYGDQVLRGTNYWSKIELGNKDQMRRLRAYIKR